MELVTFLETQIVNSQVIGRSLSRVLLRSEPYFRKASIKARRTDWRTRFCRPEGWWGNHCRSE